MTLKMTERDKKLLVFLMIFVMIVGIGAGVLYPLLDKSQSLREELTEAELEKMEKEQKVKALPELKNKITVARKELVKAQEDFYELMPSTEIDKMLTEMALALGLQVNDLVISMPKAGESAALINYGTILEQKMLQSMGQEADSQAGESEAFAGLYMAEVQMTMKGSRDALQSMLDQCAQLEPKMRIAELLWKKNDKEGNYTLSLDLDLYMYQNIEQYIQQQQMKEFEETGEETENRAEDAEE